MKILILLLAVLLAGCAAEPEPTIPPTDPPTIPVTEPTQPQTEPPTEAPDPLEILSDSMTTEEKVGQLFLCRYDAANAAAHTSQYHVGGWILFSGDFQNETPQTIRVELDALQASAKLPLLLAVDEEGGSVTRVSRYKQFREKKFNSPRYLYNNGGETLLLDTEAEKCQLLRSLGLNMNMGPVCDVTTDKDAFMYQRSLGLDPETTGQLIGKTVALMKENGIGSVLKHFPGYGNNDDTHVGIARDSRSLEALEGADLVPFRAGIDAGADCILVSHTIVEALDGTLPASLSPAVIGYLRTEMAFGGVVMTDDLAMQAVTDTYGDGEAAVLAVLAGNDLLCSTQYVTQYEAVLAAVYEGRIPMERIDEAVYHVLRWKQELGLLTFDS